MCEFFVVYYVCLFFVISIVDKVAKPYCYKNVCQHFSMLKQTISKFIRTRAVVTRVRKTLSRHTPARHRNSLRTESLKILRSPTAKFF